LLADRADLERRPLTVELSVASEGGATLWSQTIEPSQPLDVPRRFEIELPDPPGGGRYLLIRSSHCFVPLNLGLTYDPRRLGVRVTELRFRTKADTDISSH
jgi:hypothetical protein